MRSVGVIGIGEAVWDIAGQGVGVGKNYPVALALARMGEEVGPIPGGCSGTLTLSVASGTLEVPVYSSLSLEDTRRMSHSLFRGEIMAVEVHPGPEEGE